MQTRPNPASLRLRFVAATSALAIGVGLCLPVPARAKTDHGETCPPAESLVPGTPWDVHKLAPGVTLLEANRSDNNGRGLVKMHVLRVKIGKPGVSLQPLMRALAQRTPLSKLAAGHEHLVAAVNTGYFDFDTGAPTQALIVDSQPLVMSRRPQRVIGITSDGAESGKVRLSATVVAGTKSHVVSGVNEGSAHKGIVAYDTSWGDRQTPTSWQADARTVVDSKLGANAGTSARVPAAGSVLMAHGRPAERWLSSLTSGVKTGISTEVRSTTEHPFVQAFGVGTQLVKRHGEPRSGFSCSSANTSQPARTAFGIADDGKTFVIGEVEEHPGTNIHGLDNDQMSAFMAQLGVDRAFNVDGSGSTELLARLHGSDALSLRTYPADGAERPMPLGLGISYGAPRRDHHQPRR